MQIGIIQFPGSNCERETMQAVRRAGMAPVEFLWNDDVEKLKNFDGVILVGGFSYEDRSRSGIIAALHPVMKGIEELSLEGKPVLGICNGAQILVESGLVPGLGQRIALTDNKRIKDGYILGAGYYNAWVHLKLAKACKSHVFTSRLPKDIPIHIPIAHAEGRFVLDAETESQVLEQGLVVLQYSDIKGNISPEFPINPNGSSHNIAAISNTAGNVLAMMPHPERTPNGDGIFLSMRDYIASGCKVKPAPKKPLSILTNHELYQANSTAHTLIVDLIITDNTAVTVEKTLKSLGMDASIKRFVHWEILCDSKSAVHQIEASGVLYNERKSFLQTSKMSPHSKLFLVRAKDDLVGLQKKQQLKNHFAIEGLRDIKHGILWQIEASDSEMQRILESAILFNPISHVCYDYA